MLVRRRRNQRHGANFHTLTPTTYACTPTQRPLPTPIALRPPPLTPTPPRTPIPMPPTPTPTIGTPTPIPTPTHGNAYSTAVTSIHSRVYANTDRCIHANSDSHLGDSPVEPTFGDCDGSQSHTGLCHGCRARNERRGESRYPGLVDRPHCRWIPPSRIGSSSLRLSESTATVEIP